MRDYVRDLYAEEFKEAKSEGISIGLEQGKVDIAKQMLLNHEPIDKIVKYTGLTKESITKLMK